MVGSITCLQLDTAVHSMSDHIVSCQLELDVRGRIRFLHWRANRVLGPPIIPSAGYLLVRQSFEKSKREFFASPFCVHDSAIIPSSGKPRRSDPKCVPGEEIFLRIRICRAPFKDILIMHTVGLIICRIEQGKIQNKMNGELAQLKSHVKVRLNCSIHDSCGSFL